MLKVFQHIMLLGTSLAIKNITILSSKELRREDLAQIGLNQEQANTGQLVSNFACFVKREVTQEISIIFQHWMLIPIFAPS